MAITYEIFDDGQALISRVTGQVTENEWLAYREYLVTDTNVKHGFHELLDLLGITSFDLSIESMKRFSELKRKHAYRYAGRRGAIVVSNDKIFSLARHIEKLDADNNELTTVFNHMNTALTWLGVSMEVSEAAKSGKPLANKFVYDDVDDGVGV